MHIEAVSESRPPRSPIQPWMVELGPGTGRRKPGAWGNPGMRPSSHALPVATSALSRPSTTGTGSASTRSPDVFAATLNWPRTRPTGGLHGGLDPRRQFRRRARERGWLAFTLTRNRLIDHWRRTGRDRPEEAIDDRFVAAPEAEERDLHLTLRQALAESRPNGGRASKWPTLED